MPNNFSFMNTGGVNHPFGQGLYLGVANRRVQVSLRDPTKEEDIGDGFCRELARMWIHARNHSDAPPGANLPAALPTDTDELKLLHHNVKTLMVRQAVSQATTMTGDSRVSVFGLSVRKRTGPTSKTDLAKQVMRKPGRLFMCQVAFTTGGWHAVAFDSRQDTFHFFDPNTGHWEHRRTVMEKHLRDFLENYNERFDYCFGVKNRCYLIEYAKSPGF